MVDIKEELKEPMIDPTFNVTTLITLHSKRQDDLRIANERLGEEQIKFLNIIANIREEHARELRETETGRLDSIRQVDMANANNKAESLALAIQTLNSTAITNADNLRNSLNTTAATMQKTTADLATTIATQQSIRDENVNKRITTLEQSSYVGQGKEKISDPLLASYMSDIKELILKGAESKGGGIAINWVIAIILASITIGGFIINMIIKAIAAGGI